MEDAYEAMRVETMQTRTLDLDCQASKFQCDCKSTFKRKGYNPASMYWDSAFVTHSHLFKLRTEPSTLGNHYIHCSNPVLPHSVMVQDTMRLSDCSIRGTLLGFQMVGDSRNAHYMIQQHSGLLNGLGAIVSTAANGTDNHTSLFPLIAKDIESVILGYACSISHARFSKSESARTDSATVDLDKLTVTAQLKDEDVQKLYAFLEVMEPAGALDLLGYLNEFHIKGAFCEVDTGVNERHQTVMDILVYRACVADQTRTKSAAPRTTCTKV